MANTSQRDNLQSHMIWYVTVVVRSSDPDRKTVANQTEERSDLFREKACKRQAPLESTGPNQSAV